MAEFYVLAAGTAALLFFFGRNPLDPNSGHNVGDPGFGSGKHDPPGKANNPSPLPGNPSPCPPILGMCQSFVRTAPYSWATIQGDQYQYIDVCQKYANDNKTATRWLLFNPSFGWAGQQFLGYQSTYTDAENQFLVDSLDYTKIPWPQGCSQ